MTDFSHLKQYDVTSDNTVDYPITEIEGSPTLVLRPANESNRAYMNGILRSTGKRGARKSKIKVDSRMLEELRDYDRELYPEHVIVDWKNVLDVGGEIVKFTPQSAKDFIAVLPNWIFDSIRMFAANPENFVDVIDSEDKAGN